MTYTDMKDSGVPWIGNIPAHWRTVRAKFYFRQTNNRGNKTPVLLAASQKYGMCPQSWLDGVVKVAEDTDLQQFKTVHVNDFVISLRSFQGGFEQSSFEGVCSPAYQVFHSIGPYDNHFLRYLFKSEMFIDEMNSLTVGIREGKNIKYEDFANSMLYILPLNEQSGIASYLDKRCAEIDAIISEARTSIDDYKRWKASVICQSVTMGLNPDAEKKRCNIEWIGAMPKNWSLIRVKYLLKEVNHRSQNGTEKPLSMSQIYGLVPSEMISVANPAESYVGAKIVQPNDLVFNKLKAHLGVFAVSDYDGLVSPDYAVYQTNSRVLPKFLEYLFKTPRCITEFKKYISGVGAGLSRLYTSDLFNIHVALPPIDEQVRIIDYLQKLGSEIDSIISEKETLIVELESYKKSLIYEAVTGKRKVV